MLFSVSMVNVILDLLGAALCAVITWITRNHLKSKAILTYIDAGEGLAMAAGRIFRQAQEHPDEWTWLKIRAEERAGARGPAISPEWGGVRQSGRNFVRDAQAMVATTGIQSGPLWDGRHPCRGVAGELGSGADAWRQGVLQRQPPYQSYECLRGGLPFVRFWAQEGHSWRLHYGA